MDGKDLLQLLMDRRGLNPNSLAVELRDRSLQSQIQRYLAGKTKSPRPETLTPIAKFFGVGIEVFYQPALASDVAKRLDAPHTAEDQIATYASPSAPTTIRPAMTLRDTVVHLGRLLEPHDETARRAVGTLLQDMALQPSNASLAAARISALLEVQGNEEPAKYTSSR